MSDSHPALTLLARGDGHGDSAVTVWTIYYDPSDYPDKWVVRGHDIAAGGHSTTPHPDCVVCDTLAEARAAVPAGLTRFPREAGDAPAIYESWL